MSNRVVELARFSSAAEASVVRSLLDAEGIRSELSGEAMAGWFWHLGPAIGGVRLLVFDHDLDRALDILGSGKETGETQTIDFGDDSEDEATETADDEVPDDLMRAWRASLIGMLLFPPLLTLYSMWLLASNAFFVDRSRNWRIVATCLVNLCVLSFVVLIFFLFVPLASSPEQPCLPDDMAIPAEPLRTEKRVRVPLVPYEAAEMETDVTDGHP